MMLMWISISNSCSFSSFVGFVARGTKGKIERWNREMGIIRVLEVWEG
jgi:hypothetical protein